MDNPVGGAASAYGDWLGKACLLLLGLVAAVASLALLNAWGLPAWNFAVGVAASAGAAWASGGNLVLGVLGALALGKYLKG